jgi:hypothetical protein
MTLFRYICYIRLQFTKIYPYLINKQRIYTGFISIYTSILKAVFTRLGHLIENDSFVCSILVDCLFFGINRYKPDRVSRIEQLTFKRQKHLGPCL